MEKVKEITSSLLGRGGKNAGQDTDQTNNDEGVDVQNYAAVMTGKGARLQVSPAPRPVPKTSTDLVIHAHAWAVNPVDWKLQDQPFLFTSGEDWPVVLGTDVAGVVHAVGPGVQGFKVGDRVISHQFGLVTKDPRNGGFQHYTLSQTHTTARIPSTLPFTSAVVLPLALSTAAVALFSPAADNFLGLPSPTALDNPPSSGKTILVWGGSSSVGAAAVQLAVASGTKVVAVAGAANHAFVRGLGASVVLDHRGSADDVVEKVAAAVRDVGGEFVGVFDAISTQESFGPACRIVLAESGGKGGNVAEVQGLKQEDAPEGIKVGNVWAVKEDAWKVWRDYVPLALERGVLKCVPEALVVGKGLEKVQEGMDLNKKGVSAKKVVVEA